MRLAFEAAIPRTSTEVLEKFLPLFDQARGDGLLTTQTWSGPRDGQQRKRA